MKSKFLHAALIKGLKGFSGARAAKSVSSKAPLPLPAVERATIPRGPAAYAPRSVTQAAPGMDPADLHNINEVYNNNRRIWGSNGLGQIKSVDDVTRRNPNMKYLGSSEGRLPGALDEGDGVIDFFVAGPGVKPQLHRNGVPMVMRQRYRMGYDANGKALYSPNKDVLQQPVYRSSGQGSGIESAGRWVPFSYDHLPQRLQSGVQAMAQRYPWLAKYVNKFHEHGIPGVWKGKHIYGQGQLPGGGSSWGWEDLADPRDFGNIGLNGYKLRYGKNHLPQYMEDAQQLLNQHYGY